MKRPRKVFGRRRAEVEGATILVELRQDGLWLWRKHERKNKATHLTVAQLVDAANGQLKLL